MKRAWVFLSFVIVILTFHPAFATSNAGDFSGGVAVGSSYAGMDAAPADGIIIQGEAGIGTSSPSHNLDIFNGTANGVAFSGASTGNSPIIAAEGSDTNVSLSINSQGTGGVYTAGNTAANHPPSGYVGEFYETVCTGLDSGTATILIASPAVITVTNHFSGIPSGSNNAGICPVFFTTTGSLPTGITANTVYWTIGSTVTSSSFEIATSIANAIAGTAVNTSGTQSGTQTANFYNKMTSGTEENCGAVNVPAGNWIAENQVYTHVVSGTVSVIITGVSPFSASLGAQTDIAGLSASNSTFIPSPVTPYSFSATTTLYGINAATFTNTVDAACTIYAWRMP
jgi:hypothetical protein